MYVNSELPDQVRIGRSATEVRPCVAVDAGGTVHVSYWGHPGAEPVAACEKDGVGCWASSADGASFSEPRELPGAGSDRRSFGSFVMATYRDDVVVVHCVGDGECERLAVSTLDP